MPLPAAQLELVRSAHGIDHLTITVADYGAAKRFYQAALGPLGFSVLFDWPDGARAHLGIASESSSLWLAEGRTPSRIALSFAADCRESVEAFYAAALAAGGRALSIPAFRPEYTPSTYTAAVHDPDGNVVEAVCWQANTSPAAAERAA
jgi:catechol 2,3-dioxygenase-like lactoylglutathione lyase family enzyme